MDVPVPDNGAGATSLLLQARLFLAFLWERWEWLCVLVLRARFWLRSCGPLSLPTSPGHCIADSGCHFQKFNNTAASINDAAGCRRCDCAPSSWLLVLIQHELVDAYHSVSAYLSQGPDDLPPAIRNIPWSRGF